MFLVFKDTAIMSDKPLILIANDDGVDAPGIKVLTRLMRWLGQVVVVAPDSARSGYSCAITTHGTVRLNHVSGEPGLEVYSCSGTPSDCVKLALEKILDRKPDLMVSGINHGDNSSVSVHYSGTMGAVFEACMKEVPAIGFSVRSTAPDCDFSPYEQTILDIASLAMKKDFPRDVCLNVNFPIVEKLRGVRVCRLARGNWVEEWIGAGDADTFRLTGHFVNLEPEADDTDDWVLCHGMAAVTPLKLDMTHYPTIPLLKELES